MGARRPGTGQHPAGRHGAAKLADFGLASELDGTHAYTAKYFLVLVALCEPRLRDQPNHDVPTASQVAERLRPLPGCADLTRSAVNFHIDYLARTKLRFRPDADEPGGRMEGKRAALAALALRLDLVREEHLALLPSRWNQRGR
jgi:hypothetical protein